MGKYIRIARLDHWIKQFFIVPGIVLALVLIHPQFGVQLWINILLGWLATCFIASSNYVINEWLDAEFDKYHPVKKHRSVVENDLSPKIVYAMYFSLAIMGLGISFLISIPFLVTEAALWFMGIMYNVKPFRTKDIPFFDVLSESINNAIRLLLGWFIVIAPTYTFPPISVVIGYWLAGAFLMATKRFSEYRMIGNAEQAALYRKSFAHYSEQSLLISAFFYAMSSTLFIGIFLTRYRMELILFMPFYIGLFCLCFRIAYKEDSAAQKPEKLFKEKGLMLYCLLLVCLFVGLMLIDMPWLYNMISNSLLP